MGVPGEAPGDGDLDRGGPLLGPDEDVAVGALVRSRFGGEVVDRLVDPLLGGVYAGRADLLSLAATVPALFAALREHPSLVRAAAAVNDRPGDAEGAQPGQPGGQPGDGGGRPSATGGPPGPSR